MIILDTSALIDIVEGSERGGLLKEKIKEHDLGITTISINEALITAENGEKEIFQEFISSLKVFDFNEESAFKSVEVERRLMKKGQLIGKLDIFIAAICLHNNLSLATFDKDFSRIPGLKVVNA